MVAADAPGGSTPSTVTVTFSGTPPVMKKLNREADALCAKTPMTDEQVLVKDGKLQNVMVRVSRGADGSFPMPAGPVRREAQRRPVRLPTSSMSSCGSIGLVRCTWKPSASARLLSSARAKPMTAIAGTSPPFSGGSARMRRISE